MAKPAYLIGVDIGTQGTKVALVDGGDGRVAARATIPSRLIRMSGGVVKQDPAEMLQSVLDGIRQVMERAQADPSSVMAIGIDGQMAGIMGIDENHEPVTPYDSWLDTRCEAYMPLMKSIGEERFIAVTGAPVTYAHGPKVLWWKHERPEAFRRIRKFVVPSAFVAGTLAGLAGEDAYVDYTYLHFSGFCDVNAKRWSEELLKEFGVDASKMPRIVSPWDVIGHLTPAYADRCGLRAGIPIVAGCGDTAATAFGAGIVAKGMMFDVAGTASILTFCTDRYAPDTVSKTFLYARSVIDGLWAPLAYINGGGECLSWFRNQAEGEGASFDGLNEGAARIPPGSNGLYFVPHFGGRVCPNNPHLRGSWVGLNWSHDKYAMYRAILESIAYEYKQYYDTIRRLAPETSFSQVTAIGGGSRSALFNSIKAHVLGVPWTTLTTGDTALLADAVIAGYGIGYFGNLEEAIRRYIEIGERFEPDAGMHEMYLKYAESYQILLDRLTDLYPLLHMS